MAYDSHLADARRQQASTQDKTQPRRRSKRTSSSQSTDRHLQASSDRAPAVAAQQQQQQQQPARRHVLGSSWKLSSSSSSSLSPSSLTRPANPQRTFSAPINSQRHLEYAEDDDRHRAQSRIPSPAVGLGVDPLFASSPASPPTTQTGLAGSARQTPSHSAGLSGQKSHWVTAVPSGAGGSPAHRSQGSRTPGASVPLAHAPPSRARAAAVKPHTRGAMDSINISVIGAAGVGKSTLIQRALGLRSLPSSVASSLRMSVDDVVYTVSLVELDLESFDVDPERGIKWPKQINGHIVPRLDGALLLYDVMNRESIMDLPQTLNALVYSALPTILVSCKCDNPVNLRQIDTDSIEAACMADVQTVKTASNVPESARLCLGAMLRLIMAHRDGPSQSPSARRRAASSAQAGILEKQGLRPNSQQSKHSRSSSEMSLLKSQTSPSTSNSSGSISLTRQNQLGRSNITHQYVLPAADAAPPLSDHPAFRNMMLDDDEENARTSLTTTNGLGESPIENTTNHFPDLDQSGPDFHAALADLSVSQQGGQDRTKMTGLTLTGLVDRLVALPMSRSDLNFQQIFLCLYRKFAAPSELFSSILIHLDNLQEDDTLHYLDKTCAQLRIIAVVATWVSSYPGDFAGPQTRATLVDFVAHISSEPAFAAAAHEIQVELETRVVEDDDTGWARTDMDACFDAGAISSPIPSSLFQPLISSTPTGTAPGTASSRGRRPSDLSERLHDRPATDDASPTYYTVEDYEAEAAQLVPASTLPLTKFRYHICMDISDDDFAMELTRIDWVMFSSIRIRDLVRHVSLPIAEKSRCRSLANVNRMIAHFNHIARWVANLILMRDKPKHRAQMLEKFMRIALRLRQLNNYNGLAAIIAGINGTSVHRLSATRALVSPEWQKRFMRLELLMGTQKSHFAYRLAWENSSLPRIPFIPLHRRDLVSAEEGSRTFVGPANDRVNWRKFEVLAEVLLPIMRSQGTPYPNLARHETARELILDCRMETDEEEIYQRSLQLESATGNGGALEAAKKKFPWFQK